jgi:hypothetical protein
MNELLASFSSTTGNGPQLVDILTSTSWASSSS